jgi:hypothetical protein
MTIQTPDDRRETIGFKIADQKIERLLKRLNDRNVCPCCTSRALTGHAVLMAERELGTAKAIEMFEDVIVSLRQYNFPAPDRNPSPSTETH